MRKRSVILYNQCKNTFYGAEENGGEKRGWDQFELNLLNSFVKQLVQYKINVV